MARRILLADDSVTAQNMGRRILHDAGYEILTVNNGSAALKKVAEQKPDLIILDVYMPGYGGLEVCSRLKENRETQRIPVLLTVGKLEPFKPEEARRVRADAYIVKPFEASELLSALTKLEDKIVPGPEPIKPGRFAKALASVEQSDKDFGDKETGWKDRLTIPGKKSKKQQPGPELEAEVSAIKNVQPIDRGEEFRPAEPKGFERPIPGGLPQDISAEEIAAIAAAAAKISGKTVEGVKAQTSPVSIEPGAKPEVTAQEAASPVQSEPATPPVENDSTTPSIDNAKEEVPAATFASAPETDAAAAKPEETPEPVIAHASNELSDADLPANTAEEKRPANDAEVLAALAALTPANGDFSSSATAQHGASHIASGATYSGPRWAAEAVAVSDEESSCLLQQEMEKAHAAFAAADAGRATLLIAAQATAHDNGIGPTSPETASSAEPGTKIEETAAASLQDSDQPAPVEAIPQHAVSEAVTALAAAASAGGPIESGLSEPQAAASAQSAIHEEGSVMRETELAAAWANWRNIRESIVGTQAIDLSASPSEEQQKPLETAGTSPEEPQTEAPKPEQTSAETPEPEQPASQVSAAEDPAELASIVDNMLAELKPKLMEELKRKLGK